MPVIAPIPGTKSGIDAFFDAWRQAAEAKKTSAQANLPFGGANVPGPAGQVVGLQMVKMLYGENSPEYKQAQDAFNLSQQSTGSRINYQNALTGTLPLRYTTPEGRQIIEQSNVNAGASPTGSPIGQPAAPGQPAYNPPNTSPTPAQHYSLRQAKADLPAFVIQRNLYAQNIRKTLDNIDLDALTNFNGIKGHLELKQQQALDAAGESTSDEYKKYKQAESTFNFLPNQTRQFYGSSVQPSEIERRMAELDPRSVFQSSKTGKLKFKSAENLLRKELETLTQAATSGNVYSQNNENNKQDQPQTNEQSILNANQSGAPTLSREIQIPNFKSKNEFQEWFNRQPQITQDAVKLHLDKNRNR